MEFCKKCNNTGATGEADYLDCGEPGCTAATDRADFDKWLLREGYPQSGIKEWSIFRHAIRTAVEALPMALEEIEQIKLAKENLIQQVQQHAMEARTQRGTVLDILRHFGCPEEDWNALTLVKAAHEKEVQRALESQLTEMEPGGALALPEAEAVPVQAGMPAVTVETPEFIELLREYILPDASVGMYAKLIRHINAHTTQALAAKQVEIDRLRFELNEATDSLVARMAAPQQHAQAALSRGDHG